MKTIFKYILAVAAAACATGVQAQVTESGYFVEDYTYRFQLNPAMGNSKNFVAMPILGNLNFGINGDLTVKDLFYNVNGQTTTFMNPAVDAATFLGNLDDVNKTNFNLKLDILSAGFKAFGGYNTINVNVRSDFGFQLPKSIFAVLKEGISNKSYQIGDLRASATAYAEVALGHSRDITKELRVGGAVKVLVGGANVDANLRNANLVLGTDAWSITTDAEINANLKGLEFEHDMNEATKHQYVSGAEVDGAGIGGFGFAVDLGAVYTPAILPDLTVSASILDLGFINWSNNMLASTNGSRTFTTDGYIFNVDEDAPNNFDDELDRMVDDLAQIYELDDMGDQGATNKALASTIHIGAEYKFPLYRKLSFGLLYTQRLGDVFNYNDFRLSANVAPLSFFDASVNVGTGTYGTSLGWLLNVHCPGFNLFVGMDHMAYEFSKEFVPLSSTAAFNFGLNFLF